MTVQDVLVVYKDRLGDLQAGIAGARFHSSLAAAALALSVTLFLVLGISSARRQISFLWAAAPIPFAAVSGRRFRRATQSNTRFLRLLRFYDRAIERIGGNWIAAPSDGQEFCGADHAYARDLNVIGEGSLFSLLCTVRTSAGQRRLAQYLLTTPPLEETIARHAAIRELKERSGLREQIALLGDFGFLQSKWETFAEWLESPALPLNRALRFALMTSATALAGIVLLGFDTNSFPWSTLAVWIAPILAFHALVGLIYRRRVNRMLNLLHPVSAEIQVLRQGLQLIEAQKFESGKLRQLRAQIEGSARPMRQLERRLNALNQRNQPWFYGPSLAMALGTQLCMSIEQWRSAHAAALRVWLDAWAEFEALNALANYAYENPENTFPQFSEDAAKFEAKALGHPLLPSESCVRNDVELNASLRFHVVSGSNMSGKSTLLRAIGLNAVLAFAGAPVRARSLQLTWLSVWASLSVVDSLLNGKSKFLAEVERLRQTIEAAEKSAVLFLIDEIFSGTNSRDRRIASEAVVRTLLSRGAIGALSTHDVALCEIASPEFHGVNVHMGSKDGGDPLDFDYRLKQGVTTESSALAIARMAGVPV